MAMQCSSSMPAAAAQGIPQPEIEVRTSARRRRSSSAYFDNGKLVVVVPAHMSDEQRDRTVRLLSKRLLRRSGRASASDSALVQHATVLSRQYLGGISPTSVRWVSNQGRRWASCSPHTGEIRVSRRLTIVPSWVLDAVLVHELAHLIEPSHSAAFHRLASLYPRQKEADAYLSGFHLGMVAPSFGIDRSESYEPAGALDDDLEP